MPVLWEHSLCKDCWPRGSIPWPEGWRCRLQADLESTIEGEANSAYRQVFNHSLVSCMIAFRWRVCCDVLCLSGWEWQLFINYSSIIHIVFLSLYFSFSPSSPISACFTFHCLVLQLLSCTALSSLGLSCFIWSFSFSWRLFLFRPDLL